MPSGLLVVWLGGVVVFVWSAIHPHDYFTWILEVFPAIIGAGILAATYRRFRFTTLVYTLIAVQTYSTPKKTWRWLWLAR
jgi:uncharacterized membrane protein YjdF